MAQRKTKRKTTEYTLEYLDNERARIKSELVEVRTLKKYEILSAKVDDRDPESSFSDEIELLQKELKRIRDIKYKLKHPQQMKEKRIMDRSAKTRLEKLKKQIDADPSLKSRLSRVNIIV